MAMKDVISASSWYDMMLGVANNREYQTEKAARLVNAYARKTNYNMRALEKAGYDFYAYDPAKSALDSLGKTRFKTDWNKKSIQENFEEFQETARAVRRFIKNDAHTVASIQKQSTARTDWLLEHYASPQLKDRLLNPINENDVSTKRQLERLISGGSFADLISEGYGNTDEVIEGAVYALEKGDSLEAINERAEIAKGRLQLYGSGKLTIEELGTFVRGK